MLYTRNPTTFMTLGEAFSILGNAAQTTPPTQTDKPITLLPFKNEEMRLNSLKSHLDDVVKPYRTITEADGDEQRAVLTVAYAMDNLGRLLISLPHPVTCALGAAMAGYAGFVFAISFHTLGHGIYTGLQGPQYECLKLKKGHYTGTPLHPEVWPRNSHDLHHKLTNAIGDPDLILVRDNNNLAANALYKTIQRLFSLDLAGLHSSGLDTKLLKIIHQTMDGKEITPEDMKELKKVAQIYWEGAGIHYTNRLSWAGLYAAISSNPKHSILGGLAADAVANAIFSIFAGDLTHYEEGMQYSNEKPPTTPGGRLAYQASQSYSLLQFLPDFLKIFFQASSHHTTHHLYPQLSPRACRMIEAEIRTVCLQHGVPYHLVDWSIFFRTGILGFTQKISPEKVPL